MGTYINIYKNIKKAKSSQNTSIFCFYIKNSFTYAAAVQKHKRERAVSSGQTKSTPHLFFAICGPNIREVNCHM